MPPRKRQRTALSPTPSTNTPARSTPSAAPPASTPPAAPSSTLKHSTTSALTSPTITHPPNAWTPAQETDLFKALIRYKPSGIHKHFHMLCVSSFLRSHGHCLLPPSSAAGNTSTAERLIPHTRIPAIWAHLATLYDLDALDERENVHALGPVEVAAQEWTDHGEFTREFSLPEQEDGEAEVEFARMIWGRRFPEPREKKGRVGGARRGVRKEGDKDGDEDEEDGELLSSSPPVMDVTRGRDGTIVGPEATRPAVEGRGRKGKNAPRAPALKPATAAASKKQAPAPKGRARGRKASKLAEAEVVSEEEEEDGGDDEGEDEAEEEHEESDDGDAKASEDEKSSGREDGEDAEDEERAARQKDGGGPEPEAEDETEEMEVEPPARGTRSSTVSAGRGATTRRRGRGRERGTKK